MNQSTNTTIHLIRHGRVESHRGDMPITRKGQAEIKDAGRLLAEIVGPGEEIHFLCTSTARSTETAEILRETLEERVGQHAALHRLREEWAIRNPDLFLAGRRIDMVSTPEAMARQFSDSEITPEVVDRVAFFQGFFRSPDRIGYWLNHPSPPGEDAVAVGRRIAAFCTSLLDAPAKRSRRFVCVTHSPVMRAVLKLYFQEDPGEPEWVERIDLVMDSTGSSIVFRDLRAPLES